MIVLQLDPNGGITPLFPSDSEPPLRPSGVHILTAPSPTAPDAAGPRFEDPVVSSAAELAHAGRAVRPSATGGADTAKVMAYWLVVVSDVATSGRDVRAQLEAMKLERGGKLTTPTHPGVST